MRADLRRTLPLATGWAASIGAGGLAVLGAGMEGGDLPGVDVASLHGWGADVPIVVGFESDGQLYQVWVGARAGWEHVDVSAPGAQAGAAPNGAIAATGATRATRATRLWAGGLLGLAVGFRHVHVAIELDASYASIAGEYADVHTSVQGLALAPASAVWWHF